MNKSTPYQILVVGTPGRGKTMAFRNLDPNTTGFINLEKKPLPFVNNFKNYSTPNNWQEAYQKLIEYAKNPEITQVVFESFSAYVDSLMKTARDTKKGFDVFNFYNTEIGNLQNIFKLYPKHIIVSAHYEWVNTEEGALEKRVMVKGNEWKGMIEKDFTIVHYADVLVDNNGKRKYILKLQSDGKDSAKTPPMFMDEDADTIENDYNIFLTKINKVLNESK